MTARARMRGHPVYHDGTVWRHTDDNTLAPASGGVERPCTHCGLTAEAGYGPDPCLGCGDGPACCGHGQGGTLAVREIPLTRGYVTVVDLADYEDLSQFSWRVTFGNGGNPYAIRTDHSTDRPRTERMHGRILPGAERVDHINGDSLDNRRGNLRDASNAQNMQNRVTLNANNVSGYRGVSWHKRDRRWRAVVREQHLGYFDTAEQAARAFDAAAREAFGEFAGHLNFPAVMEATP